MERSRESGGFGRWLPLSGLLSVLIVVATFAAVEGDTPEDDASAAKGRCALPRFIVAAHGVLAVANGADHLTPATLQGVNVIDSESWIVFNSALGVMMLGAAGSLIPGGARALGWPALVLGIALFIPLADFVALLLTGI
jgi:hypothetical protein